ncbi:MAG: putative ATP-dependent RNA helicase dhx33 [Paramarteilia canceri]
MLPIWEKERQIVQLVESSQVCIIVGQTGSGKSTQVPQIMYKYSLNKGYKIACTQPRRIAATSLASRVSQEMNDDTLVGYSVRFDTKDSQETIIKYMTDGMLVKEASKDNLLLEYSIIILDECHERSLNSDILFGIIKNILLIRNGKNSKFENLKIIIMSATMNTSIFRNYFDQAQIVFVKGKTYPLKIYFSKKKILDYLSAATKLIFKIHRLAPIKENILCFLTGQEEIEIALKSLKKLFTKENLENFILLPLYANLSTAEQKKCFMKFDGKRKIIIATNIAETSLTIPNIVHVVDSGRMKTKSYTAAKGIEQLSIEMISKAQVRQRSGRAGRNCPGFCYRLFNKFQFKEMDKFPTAEIFRMPLSSVLMQILAAGVENINNFKFIESPRSKHIEETLKFLQIYKLVLKSEGNQFLTKLGKFVNQFPVSPEIGLSIFISTKLGCL